MFCGDFEVCGLLLAFLPPPAPKAILIDREARFLFPGCLLFSAVARYYAALFIPEFEKIRPRYGIEPLHGLGKTR